MLIYPSERRGFNLDIFAVIKALGGIAMFFYGMEIMGTGLKNSSDDALKGLMQRLTKNTFTGLLTGMIVTGIIQSSSATVVITVGLMAAGMITLKQSVSIVMGANIGTTITAQIIRLMDVDTGGSLVLELISPDNLAPIAVFIGTVLIIFVKKRKAIGIGQILAGFGLLFIGLLMMKDSAKPLAESPAFLNMLDSFSKMPLLGILAGIVITVILQSSSVVVGMIQALSSTGIMTFSAIYPVIMGINIGTCIVTAVLCFVNSSKDAKRTAVTHILFNVIGTIVFMIIIKIMVSAGMLSNLMSGTLNTGSIANFQTFFNVATAAMLFPFAGLLMKASLLIIKPDDEEKERAKEADMLSEKLIVSPGIALSAAKGTLLHMGKMAVDNISKAREQLTDYKVETAAYIEGRENRLDILADKMDNFMVSLSRQAGDVLSEGDIALIMQASPNFERIGDYATNLNEFAGELDSGPQCFSDVAKRELNALFDAVEEILNLTVSGLEKESEELAHKIEPLEEVIDDMVLLMHDGHLERLRTDKCNIQSGLIFLEILTNLERVADQCSNIALNLLARDNKEIRASHHKYLQKLHHDGGREYREEYNRQYEKYIGRLGRDN